MMMPISQNPQRQGFHQLFPVILLVISCSLASCLSAESGLFSRFSRKPVENLNLNWTQATPSAEWAGREEAGLEQFKGKLYLMAGYCGPGLTDVSNDVWTSRNGTTWTQLIAHAPWEARYGQATAVFDGKLWIMGGMNGYAYNYKRFNDVWCSHDGVHWTCATANAPWSPRASLRALVFDGKLWVMGGYDGGWTHDVWYTRDGAHWTCATPQAPWSERCAMGVTVFKNKMWILGGALNNSHYHDVWCSGDGVNWVQATANAPWPGRQQAPVVVYQNRMWILGGLTWADSQQYLNDVWWSSDGAHWSRDNAAPWAARISHQTTDFKGRIILLSGHSGSGRMADIWTAEPAR